MSGTQVEDKKPVGEVSHITLKVVSPAGNNVFFRIKRSTQLKKLMHAYCVRLPYPFNGTAFLIDGRRLRAEQTPAELEMKDGDVIDIVCQIPYLGNDDGSEVGCEYSRNLVKMKHIHKRKHRHSQRTLPSEQNLSLSSLITELINVNVELLGAIKKLTSVLERE